MTTDTAPNEPSTIPFSERLDRSFSVCPSCPLLFFRTNHLLRPPYLLGFYSSETQSATLPHLPFPLPFASPSPPALASSNSCPAQTDLQHSASEFGVYSPPRKQPLIPSEGSPQKRRGNGAGAMSLRGSPLRGGGKKQHALRGEARGEGGGAFGNGGQHMRLKGEFQKSFYLFDQGFDREKNPSRTLTIRFVYQPSTSLPSRSFLDPQPAFVSIPPRPLPSPSPR
jgi:hypothetical protein